MTKLIQLEGDDVGMFLGGLFAYVIRQHMQWICEQRSPGTQMADGEEWTRVAPALAESAFEEVVQYFPEPLRGRLLAERTDFIAQVCQLS